jgi:hypothetical protein
MSGTPIHLINYDSNLVYASTYHHTARSYNCRTEAHAAIRKRLGINLLYTDAHGDAIIVVVKKHHTTMRLDSHTGYHGPLPKRESGGDNL